MKPLFLLIIFLIGSIYVTLAQNGTTHRFIHLNKSTSNNAEGNISSIDISSNVADSSFIGVAPSDMLYTRTSLALDSGIETSLASYVRQQFAPGFKKGGEKVIWVINDLSIGTDSSQTGTVSFTKLNADIFASIASGGYRYKSSFDTLIIIQNAALDFSNSIGDALNELYNRSVSPILLANSSFNASKLENGNFSNKASIVENYNQQSSNTILRNSKYLSGIYTSYQDFLNNAPAVKNFYVGVDTGTHKVILYQLNQDSTVDVLPDAWGLSVHNELYYYQDGQLYPIEKDGKGFALSKYLDFKTRKNNAQFWRITVGKKQGDGNPYDDNHIFRAAADSISIKIEATHLDMKTGKLTF